MNRQFVIKLAVAAAAAVGLAMLAGTLRTPTNNAVEGLGGALLPLLANDINEIQSIRLVEGGNKLAVTLRRQEQGWVISERDDFPADLPKLREYLLKLRDSRLLEAKTGNSEKYQQLGVAEMSSPDASGILLEFEGKSVGKLIIGNLGGNGAGTFVRRQGEAQSWLAKGNLIPERSPANWIAKDLMDIASDRIESVEIRKGDSLIQIGKSLASEATYVLRNLPKGRELTSEYEPNGLASVLAGLRLDDVAKADTVVPDPESMVQATYRTFDGLVIEAKGFASEGRNYVVLTAKTDAERLERAAKEAQTRDIAAFEAAKSAELAKSAESANGEANEPTDTAAATPLAVSDPAADLAQRQKNIADEADVLNKRFSGWAYILPLFKYANIAKNLEDLLKPKS